ncbi:MAG: SUMF1/EgtB/PvdO family nonheme iron enzyme [Planctomycetes bacterium]|nr:SUMF1/EgtB/PvdO family nonheme iron enzyme [Planctomycetota bacterium]
MSGAKESSFTPAATAAFAEIIARHDRGEVVDFEREFAAHEDIGDELRALHRNWKAIDRLLGGMQVSESAIDELEHELKHSRTPQDVATRADLERLSSPEHRRRRYSVRERLARGGMGEVWRVFDDDLQRDLAMKVIRMQNAGAGSAPDGRLLRRFLFEARLTGRLDHPGIVPVHDIGVDADGRLYFTMPLVRGRSLSEILALTRDEKEGWTQARVLEVLLRVCDTLAFAHSQGVVHRDLKPANVMIGRFGETYVMDWGLARVLSELEDGDSGAVVGTAAYMAPEQAKGTAHDVGPRADVYALGSILYELLAGRSPYAEHEGGNGRALIDAVRAAPPRKLEEFSSAAPELIAIAKKAMVRSPDGRYASMEAMAADLRAYMTGRVVAAHEGGRWPELRKWIARNRATATTVVIAVVALTVVASWFSYSQGKSAGELQRLGDLRRLDELEHQAAELWPARPELEPKFTSWLQRAEELAARAPVHAAELERLRHAGETDADALWRVDALSELVDRLTRFRDPYPGLGTIANVARRLEESRRITRASLIEAADAWRTAIAAISDPARTPAYRGLVLEPQFGLVPLGADPASGLHEFAHVASGTPAVRDATGRLVLDDATGIVLVLVPAGTFHMGSQGPVPGQPSGPRTDPSAEANEMPLTPVTLEAFFIARFETTQAQWARLQGDEPLSADALAPARSLSWTQAERVALQVGLTLPTEAQWEYAARAGTTTRWWCGAEPGTLRGVANGARASLDTRAAETEPVDALRPNPFGLVHVHGNVAEWTRDVFGPYTTPPSGAEGERNFSENGLRCARGGSYASSAAGLRSAAREAVARDNVDLRIGVRAARAIEPPKR